MPDKGKMTAVMEKHIGPVECFCRDKKMVGFAALDHIAEFQDGKCPVQLMVMKCDRFKGRGSMGLMNYSSLTAQYVTSATLTKRIFFCHRKSFMLWPRN